jgi:hypothetical protein
MKVWAAVLAVLLFGPPASADSAEPAADTLKLRALACYRDRAAEVARADANLSDAVTFLVSDLCAAQTTAYRKYLINAPLAAQFQAVGVIGGAPAGPAAGPMHTQVDPKTAARWKSVTIDPDTGELRGPPEDLAALNELANATIRGPIPPELTAFAAQALLAARQAGLAKQP